MDLFFWRKNNKIDKFASALADEIYSSIQPVAAAQYFENTASKESKKKAIKSIAHTEGVLSAAISKIKQFRETHQLGVYGKARLHMKFMERLEELGYQSNVAKKCNEFIMLHTP